MINLQSNIGVLRPNIGLHPKYYEEVIGKRQVIHKNGLPIIFTIKKNKMICVSSNDAGGAEILSSWLKIQKKNIY